MGETTETGRTSAATKLTQLIDRLLSGQRGALAKAITAVESRSDLGQALISRIRTESHDRLGHAVVVGVTGPPGCGKSSLTNVLLGELRRREMCLGVVAIDPSSPISGGALLGDRLRMAEHAADPAVFIRSLSSRGRLGGLAPAAKDIVDVMDAAGMDLVIVETVGAGQSDVEISSLADVMIVVSAPGLGDDIQAIKSGILEIADILVVNKGDLPGAEQVASQLRAMLSLRAASAGRVPVLVTSATKGEGLTELVDTIFERGSTLRGRGNRDRSLASIKRALIEEILRRLNKKLTAQGSNLEATLCHSIQRGELSLETAAQQFIDGVPILRGKS